MDYSSKRKELTAKWYLAKNLLFDDLDNGSPQAIEYAYSNLIELYQLDLFLDLEKEPKRSHDIRKLGQLILKYVELLAKNK